jgi:alkanesulfonate monooxygenase
MRVAFTIDISSFAGDSGAGLDRVVLEAAAAAAEDTAIDRLLLSDRTGGLDIAVLASWVLHTTSTLGVEIEHRAGTLEPELAARQIATLDQLSNGRLDVRMVPPGEAFSHEQRFARLDEFLMLLKRLWSNDEPIDHEGRFHRLRSGLSAAKPFHGGLVPLTLSGVSGTAIKVAARHADRFLLPTSSVEEARRTIERMRTAATSYGRARAIRFALPVQTAGPRASVQADPDATLIAGSAERVAVALLDYCEIGVTDIVVKGLCNPSEIAGFGQSIAALVRRTLAHRNGITSDRRRPADVVLARRRRYPA